MNKGIHYLPKYSAEKSLAEILRRKFILYNFQISADLFSAKKKLVKLYKRHFYPLTNYRSEEI